MIDYKKKYLKYKKKYLDYKYNNSKNIIKGGLQKKLDKSQLYHLKKKNLRAFTEHNKDCCVCVFKSMNIFDNATVNYLTQLSTHHGFYIPEIITHLNQYHGNIYYAKKYSVFNYMDLYNEIQNGYASIGGFTFDHEFIRGHCVCYGKDDNGNLFLYDVQEKKIYWGVIKIDQYLNYYPEQIVGVWLIGSDQIIDDTNETQCYEYYEDNNDEYDDDDYDQNDDYDDYDYEQNDEYDEQNDEYDEQNDEYDDYDDDEQYDEYNDEYYDEYNKDDFNYYRKDKNNEWLHYQDFVNNNKESEWYSSGPGARYVPDVEGGPYTKQQFKDEYGDEFYETVWNNLNNYDKD